MRALIRLIAAGACLLNVSSPSRASFRNGNELLPDCLSGPSDSTYYQNQAYCIGYIIGVVDDQSLYADALGKRLYCLRPEVTAGQIKDVVVAYFQRHPEKRDFGGAALVITALMEAFPCAAK